MINPTFCIISATLSAGIITLNIVGSPSMQVKDVYNFIFSPNVPVPSGAADDNTFQVAINGTAYPVKDKFGMDLTLGEVQTVSVNVSGTVQTFFKPRRAITCGVGSDGADLYLISWNIPVPNRIIIPIQ